MKRILTFLAGSLLAAVSLQAQSVPALDYFLPDTCSYNPAVPVPASVLGFEVGEFQVPHEKGVEYFRAVEAASPRVKIFEYGRTHEQRPLMLVAISSEENIRNLDAIREEHNRLTDPSENASTDGPVFLWLGHSIHGNETSGFNASLLLVYHLAAAQTVHTDQLLENSIILVDPANNPDGIARFSEWANSHKSFTDNPDDQELEHIEAWPGGRFNHYWFDLNRDWMNQTQPESRFRAEQLLAWNPNVYTCAHEQGSDANYHFSPGEPTRIHPLIPQECQDLIGRLAEEFYAPAFDSQGMLYFSGEVFDDYYPGRGREYLDFHGGIALLWEQPSSRGFLRTTANRELSFPLSIRNQLTAELATLRGGVAMKKELLEYQKDFYRKGAKEGKGFYVFGSENDWASTLRFAETVARNGIEVYKLGSELKAGGRTFVPDSAFVVPLKQKRYRMIESIFEIREEYADSISYDITGWTLPFAFNLPYAKVASAKTGDAYDYAEPVAGRIDEAPARYAYAFEWGGFYAPRALYRLVSRGIFAKVASSPFKAGDREFDRGTVIIPLGPVYQQRPPELIHKLMQQIASEDLLDIYSLDSGFTQGHNLGSSFFLPVSKPSVAVIGGNGASAVAVGGLWHLLDQHYRIPLSILPSESLARLDLSRYNVLFVTAAHADLPDAAVEKIRQWTRSGGTLVTFEQGIQFARRLGADVAVKAAQPVNPGSYENLPVAVRSRLIPGVILDSRIDITHPLCWGYVSEELPVFKNNPLAAEPLPGQPLRTPVRHPSSEVLLSGNLLPSTQENLGGTPVSVVSRLGGGRIISYTVDPNFRAIWYGTSKLTANAIWFGALISPMSL